MADAESADRSYGGFWRRFLAYLVDSVVVVTLLFLAIPVAAMLGESGALFFTLACFLVPLAYWSLMQASARQATLGKALLGMKVASAGGERLSIGRSLGRELAKIISGIPLMIGYLLAAFTGRKQALHDIVASTVVLREGPSHTVVALLLGVFGWAAPVAVLMFVGIGALLAVMGGAGMQMMQQAMQQQAMQQQRQQQAMRPPPMKVAPRPAPVPVSNAPLAPVAPAAVQPPPTAEPAAPALAPVAMAPETPVTVPPSVPEAMRAPRAEPEAPRAEPKRAPRPLASAPGPEPKAGPAPKYNDVMTAVMMRDTAAIEELLRLGKWADKPDSYGTTPLVVAVRMHDAAAAETLLKAGADAGRAMGTAREQGDAAMVALLERYARK